MRLNISRKLLSLSMESLLYSMTFLKILESTRIYVRVMKVKEVSLMITWKQLLRKFCKMLLSIRLSRLLLSMTMMLLRDRWRSLEKR